MLRKLFASFLLAFALLATPAVAGDNLPGTSTPSPVWGGPAGFAPGYWAPRTPSALKNFNATVVTTAATVWTPSLTTLRFRVTGFCISQGVATGALTFADGGVTFLIVPQNTIGVSQCFTFPGNGYLSTAANNALTIIGASTETITGFLVGNEE